MDGELIQYRKRCKRWDEKWHAHYLTFSCFSRQPFFKGSFSPGWFLKSLDLARKKTPFDLWAWVIMPEHVHLIILPKEDVTISSILYQIKKPVTTQTLAWVRKNEPSFLSKMLDVQPNGKKFHRFWLRGGGYDRNLRSISDVHEKITYIHNNPVRRGLVQRADEWSLSSYRAWMDGVDEPIRIDRESLPILEQ